MSAHAPTSRSEDSDRDQGTVTALLDLARTLIDSPDVQSAAVALAQALPGAMNCDMGAVWLYEPAAHRMVLGAAVDAHGRPVEMHLDDVPGTRPRVSSLIQRGQSHLVVVDDLPEPGAGQMRDLDLSQVAFVPIAFRGTMFGMVTAAFRQPVPAADAACVMRRIEGMAAQASMSFENIRLLEQVRAESLRDELTGLPRRALAEDRFARAMAGRSRGDAAVGVLFVDLDGFKEVNDAHGHVIGDAILRQAANRIRSVLRLSDTCARLGGDEFVLVAPGVDHTEQVDLLASRVVSALARPFLVGELELEVSASVGATCASDPETTFDEVVARADSAMYDAKRAGKNTHVVEGTCDDAVR